MSYPDYPYEIHLHDKNGFVNFIESFENQHEARNAVPAMLADCRAAGDEYAGQHLLIVRHEVVGYTDWHEPIEKFEIFS